MFGFGKKKRAVEDSSVPAADTTESAESITATAEESEVTTPKTTEPTETAETATKNTTYGEFSRENGPFDSTEKSTAEDYLDFGSMKIKMSEGLNMRLDVEQKTQQMVAVTITEGNASLQVQAFAAPKTAGIWDEICTEIGESVREQGGTVEFTQGPLGRQLISKLPAKTADGRKGYRVARFVGVDGPRWFLRGVLSGDAAIKPEVAAMMEDVFRSIVVERGTDPRPPRDLLPMKVPESILQAQQAQAQAAQHAKAPEQPSREVPRRGPEITEIG